MFIQNVLHRPDVRQIIRCMAKAISLKVKESSANGNSIQKNDKISHYIFEEQTYCNSSPLLHKANLYSGVYEFVSAVFSARHLSAECGVVAVAYMDRLLVGTKMHFHERNWRLIIFTALLLAHKVWAEHAVWNEDFVKIFPGCWLTIEAVHRIEREFLKRINYNLNIKPSVYTKYYFELRSFANVTGDFPFLPMDKRNAVILEARSQQRTKEFHRRNRSNSTDSYLNKQGRGNISFDYLMAVRKDIVFTQDRESSFTPLY